MNLMFLNSIRVTIAQFTSRSDQMLQVSGEHRV